MSNCLQSASGRKRYRFFKRLAPSTRKVRFRADFWPLDLATKSRANRSRFSNSCCRSPDVTADGKQIVFVGADKLTSS
jgi:hypothetical protein